MKKRILRSLFTLALALIPLVIPLEGLAASCCGGGSAASLLLPKISKAMSSISFDYEDYDGWWDKEGRHNDDQEGAHYKQYRLNLGYGLRIADRWQAALSVPYVYNDNEYSSGSRNEQGLGDMTINFWYENFDDIKCIWKVRTWEDLMPAVYFGTALTVPTGTSPYDDVEESEDITGRGFYRLDGSVLLDKTIYPWNMSFQYTYGTHLERDVNREYGTYVPPKKKKLGDRARATISLGYTHFFESMNTLTFTLAHSNLKEDETEVNGHSNPATGMEKKSLVATLAFATMDRDWVVKATYNQAYEGENFPKTNIITIGVTHVYR